MPTVRLKKHSGSFGPLAKGATVDIQVPADLGGEQETLVAARKVFQEDHPGESALDWDADLVDDAICYRVVDENPYLDRQEEWDDLTLDAAATRMEDLTDLEAAQVINDVEEGVDWPWRWTDEETGREVTMAPAVS